MTPFSTLKAANKPRAAGCNPVSAAKRHNMKPSATGGLCRPIAPLRDHVFVQGMLRSYFPLPAMLAVFTITALFASRTDYLKNYKGTPHQDSRYQGGAQKIPGRVECAYCDRGGEGLAYHDATLRTTAAELSIPRTEHT
jgi:hypothetical protein